MNKYSYRICPQFEQPCTNPIIEWIGTAGLIVPCKDPKCIEVEIDPNSDSHCLEFIVFCDDCDSCPPKYYKKCFCDQPGTTIDVCHKCDDNGIIVEVCTEEELAQGKICTNDGCKCPPTKPYWDSVQKKCTECLPNSTHPTNKCAICVNGEWVQKECGDGICESSTGDCIPDCSKSTDGRTRYNPETKMCDCELGYVFDLELNHCVLVPPDCGPGTRLNPITNKCEPIPCPPGYTYSTEIDPTTGKEIGCIIDCKDKPCTNGLDCDGPNCGCDEILKICVDCTKNPNALGCKPDGCNNIPCDGSPNSCPEGCTCVNGRCVSCDNFTCDDCSKHPGCKCSDGVNCEDDPSNEDCKDKLTLTQQDCYLEAKLLKTTICQCEAISSGIKLTKVQTIPLNPAANSIQKVYLDFIVDLKKGYQSTPEGFALLPFFTNNIINNELPISGQTVVKVYPIYKNTQTGEIIELNIPYVYTESFNQKSSIEFKDKLAAELTTGTNTILLGYKWNITISGLQFPNNCEYDSVVLYDTSNIELNSNLELNKYFSIKQLLSTSIRNPLFTWKRDDSIIRKLYKTASSLGTYIDTLFGPKKFLNNTERGIQTLTTPRAELIPLSKYEISSDCNCDTAKVIDKLVICDIDFNLNEHFIVTTSNGSITCNNKLTITNKFDVCPINQDLSYFGWGNNHPAQTKYILSINGRDVATFVFKNTSDNQGELKLEGTNQSFLGYENIFFEQITSVSLRQNHDSTCIKSFDIGLELCDPEIIGTCNIANGGVDFKIVPTCTKLQSAYWEYILGRGESTVPTFPIPKAYTTSNDGSINMVGLPSKREVLITVKFENGCTKKYTVEKDCCASDSLVVTVEDLLFTKNNAKKFTFSTESKQIISSFFVNDISKDFNETFIGSKVYESVIPGLNTLSSYTIKIVTLDGCEYTKILNINPNPDTDITFVPSVICVNGVASLILTTQVPNAPFTVVSPTGSTLTGTTDIQGIGTLNNLTQGGTYILTTFNNNDIDDIEIVLNQIPQPQINSFNLISNINTFCTGDIINFTINGTPNSIVTVNTNNNQNKTITLNNSGFGSGNFSFLTSGNYILTASSISTSEGQCSNSQNLSINITVNLKPQITNILTTCIAPLSSTSDVTLKVTTNLTGLTVIAVVDNITYNLSAIVPANIYQVVIPQGSGKTIQVTASNVNCSESQSYTALSCNCEPVGMPFINNDPVACGGNVSVVFDQWSGLELEWFDVGNGNVQLTPNEWSKSLPVGTYEVRHKETATGCYSNLVNFNILDGEISVDLTANQNNPCVNQQVTLNANVVANNVNELSYSWYIDNVIQPTSGSSFIYTPTDIVSKAIKVVVQRGNTSCIAEDTEIIEAQNCCTTYPVNIVSCPNYTATVPTAPLGTLFDFKWYNSSNVLIQNDLSLTSSTLTVPLTQGTVVTLKVYNSAIPTCLIGQETIQLNSLPILTGTSSSTTFESYFTNAGIKYIEVYQVLGYLCASSVNFSGTGQTTIISSLTGTNGYYLKDTASCNNSGFDSTTLVNDINSWFSSEGITGNISWNNTNKTFTYTTSGVTDEYERIVLYYRATNNSAPCGQQNNASAVSVTLDFPCQCV